MTSMLESVIKEGTGYPNADIGRPAAGKTGTTSSFRDAWFVGYTPDLVAAVWIGNDDYTRMNESYGGNIPARIWARFMKRALAEREAARLRPAGRRGAQSQAVRHRQGRGVPGRDRARAHLRHARRRERRPRRTAATATDRPGAAAGPPAVPRAASAAPRRAADAARDRAADAAAGRDRRRPDVPVARHRRAAARAEPTAAP